MNTKKKTEAMTGFGVHKNISKFLNSFNSNRNNEKYQCLNCDDWKRGDKLFAIGQFDQMTNEIFGFRFCRACWQAYQNVSPDLKKDFIENIRQKIQAVREVKINV